MRLTAVFLLIVSAIFAGEATAARRQPEKKRVVIPRVEYVGVVSPDSSKMFLLRDFPSALSHSQSLFTSLEKSVFISSDSLSAYPADSRYLAYIRVNTHAYAYPEPVKGSEEVQLVTMALLPMIPPQLFMKSSYAVPPLQLSVDYTLCLYDTRTATTLVMHPFLFEVEQTKKERRAVQIMQPEGVEIDYPLVDKLHEALVAEFESMLGELGVR